MKKPHWHYFVMSQAFAGTNALAIKTAELEIVRSCDPQGFWTR